MAVAVHPDVTALYRRALDEAIAHVERGWTQGAYCRTGDGRACMADGSDGEIRRVDLAWAVKAGADSWALAEEELRRLVLAAMDEPYRSDADYGLERWNDQNWRTRREVVLLLERVRDGL